MFKNKKGKISILKILMVLLFVGVIASAGLFYKIRHDINALKQTVVEEVDIKPMREKKVEVEKGDPINILLLGTDSNSKERQESEGYVSRSDTIMIVSLNPETQSTKMLSIPRDTLTHIDGYDEPDKINHAYAFGGVKLSIDTVQKFLNIPIDYYAVVDMSALEELIDAIGGIEVTSPLTFTYRGTNFKKGETRKVNGVKAMNFARMRYDDPQGEIGRQNRQKIVIKAIVDKLLSVKSVSYYTQLLNVVAKNVRTNFDFSTLISIYPKYVAALNNISAIQFEKFQEIYFNDIFYFYISMSDRLKVANELRQHTQLPVITASALKDPLSDSDKPVTKTTTIVMNQYPSGMSQAEIDEINEAQQRVQTIRQQENNNAYYDNYIQPPARDNNNTGSESGAPQPPAVTTQSTQSSSSTAPVVPPTSEAVPPTTQAPSVEPAEPSVPADSATPELPEAPTGDSAEEIIGDTPSEE
ncbi:LCP family protein [Tuanshanicoccus lijuaniae]|uniref:LCP family glycopolymer transferase n=1 Tax=Aerococcaceae bacterium zg-1292 TaxID=2774330 RepID=UPI0019356968|nr:LCP family protein [Aerococcaceae bacterium zg-1292]MBS4455473.1 LCP family protein [Aerococcaceae bacterium zg-A91]MBS4457092.1 LCP family protein [Aerococcaceae bacterium zg-BR33]QQA37886.1 LCP family protein [Aerococcaceae bacterium zg-1292]